MSDDIAEAASFYTRVCEEHGRVFPLRNILVASAGYQMAEDKERFIADVRQYLLAEATALVAAARVTDCDPAGD